MMNDNIAERPFKIFIRRFKKTGALGGSTWHRKSTCSMASSVNMLFFGIVYLIACTFCSAADDEKCQSFAGGSVFPQETRRTSGHAIQWSQAVSKFCIQPASFPNFRLSWNLIRFSKASRCVSYWHLLHCFHLQEVLLLESIHLVNNIVFLCVCLPKVIMHNSTQFNVCCLYIGRA